MLPLTRFLNVDLDLFADRDLDALLSALAPRLFLLNTSDGRWTFELADESDSAEEVMRTMAAVVVALPSAPRALWDGCTRRSMNVGVQAGAAPHQWDTALSHETLTMLAGIGAEVVFTVYGADQPG
jgi:hypothetical protein